MFHRLLLPAALLCCCSGESSVHGPPETVLAFAGGDVILPCRFNITADDDFPTVEWSKEGLEPNVVFLYRDGCETYEMKNPAFHYRTSFVTKELKNRNISLRISNVQLSDAGKYRCMKLWKNAPREITTVELVVVVPSPKGVCRNQSSQYSVCQVQLSPFQRGRAWCRNNLNGWLLTSVGSRWFYPHGAVSEPKLSVIPADGGEVTLQCDATCCLLEPELHFVDAEGNSITAGDPKRHQDDSGCYTVTRRVTLQNPTNSVTCRVHHPEINQTRTTQIQIPVYCMRSCFRTAAIAVGVTVLLLAPSCGLAVFLWNRYGKSAEAQKLPVSRQSSDESTVSVIDETQVLLTNTKASSAGNSTIEKLARKVADLESKLHERDETICQLQNKIKTQLSPIFNLSQPTIVCSPAASTSNNPQTQGPKPAMSRQHSVPGPDHLIRRNRRLHSNPDVLDFDEVESSSPSSGNASKKKLGDIGRSMSESSAWPVPKLQRRHSSVFPLSAMSNNRFALLANLKEESELLMA